MLETVLHGPLDNLLRFDETVGFRHYLAVDASRLMVGEYRMIFYSLNISEYK